MKTITSEQYVAEKGVVCPFCGSSAIEGDSVEIEAGSAYQDIGCLECDSEWRDFYALIGYRAQEG